MKPSGIEWIGDIPDDWEVTKIGQLYLERNEKVSDREYEALSVTKHGILKQLESAAKTDNGDNRKLVKNGDFVINSRSDRRGSCGISKFDGSVSLINIILMPTQKIANDYYNYLFRTENFADEFYKYGNGIVDDLWSTKWTSMKKILVPFPSLRTQQRIADYLDEKCGEIDATITKQKESIEKLKAYKQSLISETVTKGLDKSAPIKPSGIEWIGDIPAHWEVCKIKNHCNLKTGSTPSSKDLSMFDGAENWFTPSDFTENYMLKNSLRRLNAKVFDQNLVPIFPPLSVLIVGIGATTGKVGFTTSKSSSNQQITAIIPKDKNIFPKFLLFWMIANTKMMRETALFTTLPILNNDTLGNATLLIPPYKEQLELASYIENKNIEIDVIINKKQNIIQKLDTYKKSLIFECVTGKMFNLRRNL